MVYVFPGLCIFGRMADNFNLNLFIDYINNIYPSLKFTYELETDNKLPFLDLLISNNEQKIEFDIYRKTTHTDIYINNTSMCPNNHKHAVFHSLIHRLINVPLSKEKYIIEYNKIINIAKINGYDKNLIQKIHSKHTQKNIIKHSTSLKNSPIQNSPAKYIKILYHPSIHYKIKNIFSKHNIITSFYTNTKIKFIIGNPLDKINNSEKSGIYKINCNKCNKIYIGQTQRNLDIRFKEHKNLIKNLDANRSSLAFHKIKTGHDIGNITLLRENQSWNLNMLEAIEMKKYSNILLNNDLSCLENPLLDLIPNKCS